MVRRIPLPPLRLNRAGTVILACCLGLAACDDQELLTPATSGAAGDELDTVVAQSDGGSRKRWRHPKTTFEISPDTAILAPGAKQKFTAVAYLKDGSTVPVEATFTATGGTITPDGIFTAGESGGSYQVIALDSGQGADTAAVTVADSAGVPEDSTEVDAPEVPHVVSLSPSSVELSAGQTQQFSVTVKRGDELVTVDVRFRATGGTISEQGLYTAGSTAGHYAVVVQDSTGAADTSAVAIVASGPSTSIAPGMDIQASVDAYPAGTEFVLEAGVHRMQTITPKDGNVFRGEPGAILSGARLLNSFSQEGGYWVASGQTQQGPTNSYSSQCQSAYAGCSLPEDLFIDDRMLVRVTSLGAVAPGKWYFDYGADKIYFADDPTGRKVETSVTTYAFIGSGRSNVRISGLTVEKYAVPAQKAAIQGDGSRDWIVEDNLIRWNHGVGLRVGHGMQVLRNRVLANGQLGIGGSGTNILVEGNEIAYNNTAGYNAGWEAGGTKWAFTDGLTVRGNHSHDNRGVGLWTDIDNINTLYENNLVENNDYAGIFHEISYRAVIRNNTARGNGFRGPRWGDGAGIEISSSPDVEVYGNTVVGNRHGISGLQYDRGTGRYGPYILQNLHVHDNTISMSTGQTGIWQNVGSDEAFTSRNNRFERNTYELSGTAKYFQWLNATRTDQEWHGYGHDDTGVVSRR